MWIADYDGIAGAARLQHIDPRGRLITRVSGIDWAPAAIVHCPDGSLIYASQHDGLRSVPQGPRGPARRERRRTLHPEEFMEPHGSELGFVEGAARERIEPCGSAARAGLNRFKTGVAHTAEPSSRRLAYWFGVRQQVWRSLGQKIASEQRLPNREMARLRTLGEARRWSQPPLWSRRPYVDGGSHLGAWHVHGDQVKAVYIPAWKPYGIDGLSSRRPLTRCSDRQRSDQRSPTALAIQARPLDEIHRSRIFRLFRRRRVRRQPGSSADGSPRWKLAADVDRRRAAQGTGPGPGVRVSRDASAGSSQWVSKCWAVLRGSQFELLVLKNFHRRAAN